MLICLAFPEAQGCAAEIDDGKSLITQPGENRIFAAASAEKARMGLLSVSLAARGLYPSDWIGGNEDRLEYDDGRPAQRGLRQIALYALRGLGRGRPRQRARWRSQYLPERST
jgi:hypothetical protein